MEKYDVVIVGGGCAGAAAGVVLAKAGRKILIIDKAVFPRQKVCGGMITDKTVELLQEIYSLSFDALIDSQYSAFGVYHKDRGRICSYDWPRYTLSMIHRDVFDHFFLMEAEKAGCTTILGDKVVGFQDGRIRTSTGKEIYADFVIGADGPNSVVRKALLGDGTRDFAMGLEVHISYENLKFYGPGEPVFPWIFFGYVRDGYGWLFPKRDFVTVGIAARVSSDTKSLLTPFRAFLADVAINPLSAKTGIQAHPVPVNERLVKVGYGNVLLVGDAARLVEPLTGEGIYFAALSGSIAAGSILAQGDAAALYNRLIQKWMANYFRQARLARAIYYNKWVNAYAMNKMGGNAKWCKYFLALLSGDMNYVEYFRAVLRDRSVYQSAHSTDPGGIVGQALKRQTQSLSSIVLQFYHVGSL